MSNARELQGALEPQKDKGALETQKSKVRCSFQCNCGIAMSESSIASASSKRSGSNLPALTSTSPTSSAISCGSSTKKDVQMHIVKRLRLSSEAEVSSSLKLEPLTEDPKARQPKPVSKSASGASSPPPAPSS